MFTAAYNYSNRHRRDNLVCWRAPQLNTSLVLLTSLGHTAQKDQKGDILNPVTHEWGVLVSCRHCLADPCRQHSANC